MVESTGLENRRTLIAYLGFKSLSLRHIAKPARYSGLFAIYRSKLHFNVSSHSHCLKLKCSRLNCRINLMCKVKQISSHRVLMAFRDWGFLWISIWRYRSSHWVVQQWHSMMMRVSVSYSLTCLYWEINVPSASSHNALTNGLSNWERRQQTPSWKGLIGE